MARPPIYYINLRDRTDRRAFMQGQFAKLGLDAVRVDAVSIASLTSEQLTLYCDESSSHYLRPPAAACTLSHVKCWEAFLAIPGSPQWALILEDDAVLSGALPAFLDDL